MDRAEVLQVLRDKAGDLLGAVPEALPEEQVLGELAADPLYLCEWVMEVEDALGVRLDGAVTGSTTLGEAADAVVGRLTAVAAAGS